MRQSIVYSIENRLTYCELRVCAKSEQNGLEEGRGQDTPDVELKNSGKVQVGRRMIGLRVSSGGLSGG
jgi:hypothetical protein